MYGALHGRVRPLRSVRNTENLVLARVRAGAQPLPDEYGEGQGVIPDLISEGVSTHPWPDPVNTRRLSQGEQRYIIGGVVGGSGTPPTPTQVEWTYPPLRRSLQL